MTDSPRVTWAAKAILATFLLTSLIYFLSHLIIAKWVLLSFNFFMTLNFEVWDGNQSILGPNRKKQWKSGQRVCMANANTGVKWRYGQHNQSMLSQHLITLWAEKIASSYWLWSLLGELAPNMGVLRIARSAVMETSEDSNQHVFKPLLVSNTSNGAGLLNKYSYLWTSQEYQPNEHKDLLS